IILPHLTSPYKGEEFSFSLFTNMLGYLLLLLYVGMNDEVDEILMVKELKDGKDGRNKSSFSCKIYREDCPPCILNFPKT
ncbi:MAG: hypothetical protein AABZ28_06515, partial [Nitrospinota bacterium]